MICKIFENAHNSNYNIVKNQRYTNTDNVYAFKFDNRSFRPNI